MDNEPSEKEKSMAKRIVSGDESTASDSDKCGLKCRGVGCSGTLDCKLSSRWKKNKKRKGWSYFI
jgi:hypothetical protein